MEKLRTVCKRLFCLPALPTLLIAVPSMGFCFVALGLGVKGALGYVSYFLSAYSLALIITLIVRAAKSGGKINFFGLPVFNGLRRLPLGARYLDDAHFRSEVSLYMGLFLNCAYALIKLFSGVYYRSLWFAALAFYYLLLAAMRFSLLRHVRKSPFGSEYRAELRRYRLCGAMLAALNLALCAIVTMVVIRNRGFSYAGYLIYVMAIYAFYSVISSVISVVKYRRYNSPVLSAAKVISLTTALVSMLSLETAMLSTFGGDNDVTFRRAMTATTGFFVCALVFGMAIFMVVRANRELKSSL